MDKGNKELIRKELFKGGAWAFGGKMLTLPLGLLINGLLARILGPEQFGVFLIIQSLVMVMVVVITSGLKQTLVKYISEILIENNLKAVFGIVFKTFLLLTGASIFFSLILLLGGIEWLSKTFFKAPQLAQVGLLIILWIVLQSFLLYLAEVFIGFNDIKNATIFGAGGIIKLFICLWVLFIWLFYSNGQIHDVLSAFTISFFVSIILSAVVLFLKLNKREWNRSVIQLNRSIKIKEILIYSWPIWITHVAFLIMSKGDLWILGYFESQTQVALYGATLKLIALISVPLSISQAILPPVVSDKYAKGELDELEYSVRLTTTITAIPAICIFIVLALFGEFILELIFGNYYRQAYTVLLILSFGGIAQVLSGSNGITLMMSGNQKSLMLITIIVGFFTLALGIVLVQFYSMTGLAFSMAFGYFLTNVVGILYVKMKLGIWTIPKI